MESCAAIGRISTSESRDLGVFGLSLACNAISIPPTEAAEAPTLLMSLSATKGGVCVHLACVCVCGCVCVCVCVCVLRLNRTNKIILMHTILGGESLKPFWATQSFHTNPSPSDMLHFYKSFSSTYTRHSLNYIQVRL